MHGRAGCRGSGTGIARQAGRGAVGLRHADAPGTAAGRLRRGAVVAAPEPRAGVRQRQPDADRRSRAGAARGVPADRSGPSVLAARLSGQRGQPRRPAGDQHQWRQAPALRRHAGPAARRPGGAAGGRIAALRRAGGEERRRLRPVQTVHRLAGRLRRGDGSDVPPGDAAGGGMPAGCRVSDAGAGHGRGHRGTQRGAVAVYRRAGFVGGVDGCRAREPATGAGGAAGACGWVARIGAAPDCRGRGDLRHARGCGSRHAGGRGVAGVVGAAGRVANICAWLGSVSGAHWGASVQRRSGARPAGRGVGALPGACHVAGGRRHRLADRPPTASRAHERLSGAGAGVAGWASGAA